MQRTLSIGPEAFQQMRRWVVAGYPRETCGVLLGAHEGSGDAGIVRVVEVRQANNLNTERARDRYHLDPKDLLEAEHYARENDLEVVGIWHSHPDHPASPSETDRRAAWPGWSYLILSVDANGALETRSWRLDSQQQFLEEEIRS